MTLRATDLGCRRARRWLLQRLNLDLAPGELHAVLGPNGAGKSTLLRLMAGEYAPDAGDVMLDGRPLGHWQAAALARRRAVLPQEDALRFPFPVSDVVRLGRLPCPYLPPVAERARVLAALEETGAGHLIDRAYTDLSGGERQRVQLARVLVQVWDDLGEGARYLLLDEPTSALDLSHQHDLLALLRRRARSGLGVLFTVHDPNLALAYADRVTVLCCGEPVAAGQPAEVLQPPLMARIFGVHSRPIEVAPGRWQLLIEGRTTAPHRGA